MSLDQALKTVSPSLYVKQLFDPVQTHAVYGVHPNQVESVKRVLKQEAKATRFRVVKASPQLRIVCFKIK